MAGKIKKVFRDKEGEINAETRKALKAELGDVLWYLAQVTFLIRHFSQFTLHAMQIWIQESQPQ